MNGGHVPIVIWSVIGIFTRDHSEIFYLKAIAPSVFLLQKKKKKLVKLVGFGKSSPKKKKKMSLFGKVEADVEIKAPAEKFHELFSCRPHHISNVSPGKVQGCALHEGDWGKEGSVIFWDYVHGKAIPDHILHVYMTMYYYVFTCLIKLHTQYTRNMV